MLFSVLKQQRLSAMEGIECRMRTMMNKYDTMLKENRELKLENSKQMKLVGIKKSFCLSIYSLFR